MHHAEWDAVICALRVEGPSFPNQLNRLHKANTDSAAGMLGQWVHTAAADGELVENRGVVWVDH